MRDFQSRRRKPRIKSEMEREILRRRKLVQKQTNMSRSRFSRLPLADRISALVIPHIDGCLIWIGSLDTSGYGKIQHDGRTVKTHRLSYFLRHGTIPGGAHILHRCDRPDCVNPDHLFAGSHKENMRDRENKGRGVVPVRKSKRIDSITHTKITAQSGEPKGNKRDAV